MAIWQQPLIDAVIADGMNRRSGASIKHAQALVEKWAGTAMLERLRSEATAELDGRRVGFENELAEHEAMYFDAPA